MSTICFRYDVAPIEKYELTPEGYLRCWSTIARTGVQMYTDSDGSIRREYRPESEVASPESLASFAGKAITLEHPKVLLDSTNTKDYQIGFSGTEVVYDNGFVRAVMTITDQDAIERIMRGDAKEVSAGYRVNYEANAGVTDSGENYDGIQKEISGNHIAVVRRGRAGPQVKLHLDRLDAADPSLITPIEEPSMTAKVNFDGAEFEVTESVALAVTKEREDAKMSYEGMKKKYDELQAAADSMKADMASMEKEMKAKQDSAEGRADALAEENTALKADLDGAKQVNVDSLVEERIALIDQARTSLDSAFDFAGKSAREIMEASIKAVRGDADLSVRSDDYVTAMFDTLVEAGSRDDSGTKELRQAVASIASPMSAPSSYMERTQNAWKTPLSVSKER
ncbi:Uncharacterised conserved protein UCP029215 [uncultured Caudovirales phage]|uniref:Uncharacterized conserved protein UCP029215 n=1 Tax=uncultured Caudovirales phage TaxID=2100421 RepID=A0A6J5NC54_9CAUD|nr:Uncharacterised conserved protein UCP029215 [uncultured Caudovirales phage]